MTRRPKRAAPRNTRQIRVADPTQQGETMTTVRTDEAINQYWDLHLRELDKAKTHGEEAGKFEDEASQRRAHAAKRREDAAHAMREAEAKSSAAIREAEAQEASAETAASNAVDLRQAEKHHRDIAADHAETVQDKCKTSNRRHPAERQQQYGPQNGGPVDSDAMDRTGMQATFTEAGAP